MHVGGSSKRLHGVPQALEVSSLFLYALLFSLGVEVVLFVIVESDTYALDLPDELLEQLLLLRVVLVVGRLKIVPHLLRTLVIDGCVSLLQCFS